MVAYKLYKNISTLNSANDPEAKAKAIQVIELLKKSVQYIPSSCLFNCLTKNVKLLYKNGQSGCAMVVQNQSKTPYALLQKPFIR
jgi:hypothetical protein